MHVLIVLLLYSFWVVYVEHLLLDLYLLLSVSGSQA